MEKSRVVVWPFDIALPDDILLEADKKKYSFALEDEVSDEILRQAQEGYNHCFALMRSLRAKFQELNSNPKKIVLGNDGGRIFQILAVVDSFAYSSEIIVDIITKWAEERSDAAYDLFAIDVDFMFVEYDEESDLKELEENGYFLSLI